MRRGFLMVAGLGALSASAALADPPAVQTPVERGAYIVRMVGCMDCHTPMKMGPKGPEPDLTRMLSGHPEALEMPPAPDLGKGPWAWAGAVTNTAFAGPWGVSFAANLTPDKETGLGSWTEKMFIDTLRSGRHQGRGRPILPPMPFQAIGTASDQDLAAIFAYLQSLTPIVNRVPQPVDPPQSQR